MQYELLLHSSLIAVYVISTFQLILAFAPRFSALILLNALLLAMVFVPLATDQLDTGSRVGFWLWLANGLCSILLLVRYARHDFAGPYLLPAVGSLLGLLAFGMHVLIFAACP